ncbi:hypothetical protein ABZ990_26655 [Streptomyces sp. NPDC046203]|uniref:hypothetical protein n=1 Tax=Streptomyces sp. NPDC046203 TaxID=3154602 RepID=UPI0033C5905A
MMTKGGKVEAPAAGPGRESRGRSSGQENWAAWWWIPLGIVVLAAAGWGLSGWIEGGCPPNPLDDCVVYGRYRWLKRLFLVMVVPALAVCDAGLRADRWPPVAGLALGAAAVGAYEVVQATERSVWHAVPAVLFLVLAAVAPLVGRCRVRARRRTEVR